MEKHRKLAEDAVRYEPVSTSEFPANREIYRELHRIRLLDAILNADTRANSEPCSEIPYSAEQGIFAKEQGICAREQGILNQLVQSDFRMMFSEGTAILK
jgi:hypothetical protein